MTKGMLYRALVVGLLGAIAMLVAALPGDLRALPAPPAEKPAVVDVSRSAIAGSPRPFDQTVANAIGLAEDEVIERIELTVSDGRDERRVVVRVHP